MKYPKCIQCGICCKIGSCDFGKEDKHGSCIYLRRKNDIHYCLLILEKKISIKDLQIGIGCVLKAVPKVYSYYKKSYGDIIAKEL